MLDQLQELHPIPEIHVTPTNAQELEHSGLGSERLKWGTIENLLSTREKALARVSTKTRLTLQSSRSQYTHSYPIPAENDDLGLLQSCDDTLFRYIREKLEQVLYGKGLSEIGYQDEAGIAHSQLIALDMLGLVHFPDYHFSRESLEQSYLSAFVHPDDRQRFSFHALSNKSLLAALLLNKEGSNALAFYHARDIIDWQHIYSLPHMRRAHHRASKITRSRAINQNKHSSESSHEPS